MDHVGPACLPTLSLSLSCCAVRCYMVLYRGVRSLVVLSAPSSFPLSTSICVRARIVCICERLRLLLCSCALNVCFDFRHTIAVSYFCLCHCCSQSLHGTLSLLLLLLLLSLTSNVVAWEEDEDLLVTTSGEPSTCCQLYD
jgi:hypothetical protein